MSDNVFNLRQKRKNKKREEKDKSAAENRLRFGEAKNTKALRKKETARIDKHLEGIKRNPSSLDD